MALKNFFTRNNRSQRSRFFMQIPRTNNALGFARLGKKKKQRKSKRKK